MSEIQRKINQVTGVNRGKTRAARTAAHRRAWSRITTASARK
jgi:hypothetical protein